MEPKEQRKVDDFIVYAMAAADQALDDAGWNPETTEDAARAGVLIGSGIGGLQGIEKTAILLAEKGSAPRLSPFFIPGPADQSCRRLCLDQARSEGAEQRRGHRLLDGRARHRRCRAHDRARRCRRDGRGGTESPVCRLAMAGFAACRALSTHFNDEPTRASRPYDHDRDGFVMGEGAGVVVLEDYEHAKARGAKIYAEVDRLWPLGRCLSHHGPRRGWRRRLSLHEDGDEARRHHAGRNRLHQRAWHLDADGRRDRAWRRRAAVRQQRRQARRCRRPNRRPGICSAPRAPSRRSSRSSLFGTILRRRRSTSTTLC